MVSVQTEPSISQASPAEVQIPLFRVFMAGSAAGAVGQVLDSGYIGQGREVDRFEAALGKYFDNPNVVTVNSATSGLSLALHMLAAGDGEGEVLSTPLTCTATNWVILANRLGIRWVDVDPQTANLDLDDLEQKLSPKTRAILVVHWGGYPNDLDRLRDLQDLCQTRFGHRPPVIEDCAHAWGSTYDGRKLGNHGNICVYSLQAIKHITAGDGGVMVLPNQELADRAILLRWYGIDRRARTEFRCEADIPEWGYKFHMNDINAVIGMSNLACANEVVAAHQANARYYRHALAGLDGITLLEDQPDRTSGCWLFTLRVQRRDDFDRALRSQGVMTSRVHERNDKHSCVAQFRTPLPGMDQLQAEMTCIPVGWWVHREQREYIVEVIRRGW